MPRKLALVEAKQRAGRFCAFRERSPKEVSDKLKSWGLAEKEVEKLLCELIDQNFVDEQRFARAYCHDKFQFNSWGKLKIKAHIFVHQLPSDIVEEALGHINDEEYFQRLVSLAGKKHLTMKGEDRYLGKKKMYSYLTGKGYEPDLIWKAIEKLDDE